MLTLGKIETQLKPKLFKKDVIHHRIWQSGELFSYNIVLLRYLNFKYLLTQAQMVAYKKLKIEYKDWSRLFKNWK